MPTVEDPEPDEPEPDEDGLDTIIVVVAEEVKRRRWTAWIIIVWDPAVSVNEAEMDKAPPCCRISKLLS